jgi:FG-GAP repeat
MKRSTFFILFIIACHWLQAQSVGIGTTTPHASAQIDVSSTNKGVLLPRITTAQRKAITSPEQGLMVFDTDKRTIMIYEGTRWGQLVYKDSEQAETVRRKDSSGQVSDRLGASVAMSGDYAIAGCPYADNGANTDQGAAIIFERVNGNWVQKAKVWAADGAVNDLFGFSVSISGDYAVVGAYQKDGIGTDTSRGAAYVFVRTGNVWTQQAKLLASDGAANDHFGYSVGISGDNIIIGTPDDNLGANADQGSVYFFSRNGTLWQQDIRLTTSGAFNHFGYSVAISNIYAIVGSPGNSSAIVYVKGTPNWSAISSFTKAGEFGTAVSIDGETAAVGNPNSSATGIVYVFARGAFGIWTEQAFFDSPSPQNDDQFGISVSLNDNGNELLVGSPSTAYGSGGPGTAFIFKRTGVNWGYSRKVDDSSPVSYGRFANSVAFYGFNLVIGAQIQGEIHFLNLE